MVTERAVSCQSAARARASARRARGPRRAPGSAAPRATRRRSRGALLRPSWTRSAVAEPARRAAVCWTSGLCRRRQRDDVADEQAGDASSRPVAGGVGAGVWAGAAGFLSPAPPDRLVREPPPSAAEDPVPEPPEAGEGVGVGAASRSPSRGVLVAGGFVPPPLAPDEDLLLPLPVVFPGFVLCLRRRARAARARCCRLTGPGVDGPAVGVGWAAAVSTVTVVWTSTRRRRRRRRPGRAPCTCRCA